MQSKDIYQMLWSSDGEKIARSIINDFSISPFLRVWALLIVGRKRDAKENFKNLPIPTEDEFEKMLQEELWLFFNSSKLKPAEFRERIAFVVKRFPYSIGSRITLARLTREYTYARDLYATILELCPSSLHAIAGLIQTSILLGDKHRADSMLRHLKQELTVATLSIRRKAYWNMILSVYRVIMGEMVGIRLILGMFVVLAGFLMPTTIVIPIIFFVTGIAFGFYFIISDVLVSTFFFSQAFLFVLVYFIGYGTRMLFTFLEGL